MKKNLFQNGDFKDAMRDWSLQTVSTLDSNNWVTGTLSAGAAGFTQSSSTTAEALEGRTSGKWAKGAANYQRQGFQSEVLQIDKELQGNVCKFEFSYNLTQVSGTLSLTGVVTTHDIKIAIYDITNSAWIQPSGHMAINSIGIAAIATGEFQLPINTAQVKMFIYQATTSTAAWTLVADQFFLGKVERVYGFSGNDWKSVTVTGSWVTNATYTAFEKIVGDTAFYKVKVATSGAPTSASLTINLPSGRTIDTAKLQSTSSTGNMIGFGNSLDAATNNYPLGVWYQSTTSVGVHALNASGTYATGVFVTQAIPHTFGASDEVNIEFSVPIVGLSSSTVVSSDADTRVVAVSRGSGVAQSIPHAIYTPIDFATQVATDTHGAWSNGVTYNAGAGTWASDPKYTIKVPGKYHISAKLLFQSSAWTAGNIIDFVIRKNGGGLVASVTAAHTTGSYYMAVQADGIVDLVPGDVIVVTASQNSGGAKLLEATSTYNNFSINMIQGPATIAASETIGARYTTAAAQTIATSTNTIIDFGTKVFDSRNSVTTGASWKFVAPDNGTYSVSARVLFDSYAWTVAQKSNLQVWKNGSYYTNLDRSTAHATNTFLLSLSGGSAQVKMLAGDYIDIRVDHDRGSNSNLFNDALFNWVDINRTGNY
jgi:hypothetical protein